MHGSEIWPMKVEHELKMNRTEMSMIRWMCVVKPEGSGTIVYIIQFEDSSHRLTFFCKPVFFRNNHSPSMV